MNIELSSLSTSLLQFLKESIDQELVDAIREIERRQGRLDDRLEKRSVLSETLEDLQSKLSKAEGVLSQLNDKNASAESIVDQQEAVDNLAKAYELESKGNGTTTEKEATREQLSIDRMEAANDLIRSQISSIQTELDSR